MEEKKEVKDQKVKVIVTPILLPGGPNGNGNGKDDKDKDKKKKSGHERHDAVDGREPLDYKAFFKNFMK